MEIQSARKFGHQKMELTPQVNSTATFRKKKYI